VLSLDEPTEAFGTPAIVEGRVVGVSTATGAERTVFAICSSESAVVFELRCADTSVPFLPLEHSGTAQCQVSVKVTRSLIKDQTISSVQLSPDGRFLAVGADHNSSVFVFSLESRGDRPTLVLEALGEKNSGEALYSFLAKAESPALYSQDVGRCRTHTLVVVRRGTMTAACYAMTELFPGAASTVTGAKSIVAARQQPKEISAAAAPVKGKEKGKASAAAVVEVATSATPKVEFFYSGKQELLLPNPATCLSLSPDHVRCAIGCTDGFVVFIDELGASRVICAAPHRISTQPVNALLTQGVSYFPGDSKVLCCFAVPGVPYKSFVDVYDLAPVMTRRVSRLRYIDNLRAAIPIGSFPLYVLIFGKSAVVVDANTAEVLRQWPDIHSSEVDAQHIDVRPHAIIFGGLTSSIASVRTADVVQCVYPSIATLCGPHPSMDQLTAITTQLRHEHRQDPLALRQLDGLWVPTATATAEISMSKHSTLQPKSNKPSPECASASPLVAPRRVVHPGATLEHRIRAHLDSREDEKRQRQERVKEFWSDLKRKLS
jgi:hypothetical protein